MNKKIGKALIVVGCIAGVLAISSGAYALHMRYEPEVYESYNIKTMDSEGRG